MLKFTLYSKPGCSLCDMAKAAIEAFAAECPLDLDVIDINSSPALTEAYQYDIPVLLIDGEEAARHHISVGKLRVIVRRRNAPAARNIHDF